MRYVVGLDYGTESARAVLVNVATGEVAATAVHAYTDGVIDEALPSNGEPLSPNWALQNPADWLTALEATVSAILRKGNLPGEAVVGLGIDFMACTVLPTEASGTPLCILEDYRDCPHAWPKLWKHHAAQPQADRVNELAIARGEPWLSRYGGKVSSEWLIPKALQILEEAPDVYAATDCIVEGGIGWRGG